MMHTPIAARSGWLWHICFLIAMPLRPLDGQEHPTRWGRNGTWGGAEGDAGARKGRRGHGDTVTRGKEAREPSPLLFHRVPVSPRHLRPAPPCLRVILRPPA